MKTLNTSTTPRFATEAKARALMEKARELRTAALSAFVKRAALALVGGFRSAPQGAAKGHQPA